jgi:hypothetical protein
MISNNIRLQHNLSNAQLGIDVSATNTDSTVSTHDLRGLASALQSTPGGIAAVYQKMSSVAPEAEKFFLKTLNEYEIHKNQPGDFNQSKSLLNKNLVNYVNQCFDTPVINYEYNHLNDVNGVSLQDIDVKHTNILIVMLMVMIALSDHDGDNILNQVKVISSSKDAVVRLNESSNAMIVLSNPPLTTKDGKIIDNFTTLIDIYKNHPEQMSEDSIDKCSPLVEKLQTLIDPNTNQPYWDQVSKTKDSAQQNNINAMLDSFLAGINNDLEMVGAGNAAFKKDTNGNYLITPDSIISICQELNAGAAAGQNITGQQSQLLTLAETNLSNHVQIGSTALSYYKSTIEKIFSF